MTDTFQQSTRPVSAGSRDTGAGGAGGRPAQRRPQQRDPRARVHHSAGTVALAQGLGWFSIALGAAELFAPGSLARALGSRQQTVVAMFGAREVVAGLGILAARDPTPWIYGRIAGDALDLAALSTQLGRDNPNRAAAMTALGAVIGVTALDLLCAAELAAENRRGPVVDYGDRSGLGSRSPDRNHGSAPSQRPVEDRDTAMAEGAI